MKRIEAGAIPPLNPSPLQRRFTALTSRALDSLIPQKRQSSTFEKTLQEITLRPVFDDAVVLDSTRREFGQPHVSFPQGASFPQELRTISPAMGNSVKDRRLTEIIPLGVGIERFPEATEEHNLDAVADAYSKAISAARLADAREDLRQQVRKGELVTVGVDVLTAALVRDEKGARYERLGKPKNIDEVKHRFSNAHELVETGNLSGYTYMTEVATVVHNPFYPNRDAWTVRQALVILSPELLAHLATPQGFDEYQERARAILNGLHQPINHEKTILNTAGGFVIEAFKDMMNGKGIQTIITNPYELTPTNMRHKPFDEQAYQQAEDIARGHADEALIHNYCQKFKSPTPISLVN